MSVVANRGVVRKELLKDVVENSSWRVDNFLDEKYGPRSVNVIIKEAKAQVGREMEYSIVSSNCEHFVTNLRYGKPQSRQVIQARNIAVASMGAAAFMGLGVYAFAGSLSGRDKNKHQDTE